jgi:hypothetical protein
MPSNHDQRLGVYVRGLWEIGLPKGAHHATAPAAEAGGSLAPSAQRPVRAASHVGNGSSVGDQYWGLALSRR